MTTNIKNYSTTQSNNTSLNSISVAEGMLPSNLNNAIRALMKNTRDWFNDAQWIEYGDGDASYTATYVSATSFKIVGSNVTSDYHAGRRIKITATTPGTIFGTISSSSFSTDTTVVVSFDSGNLSNEAISNVYLAALTKTNSSIPEGVISTATLADGSVTTAKLAADAVNGTKIADDSINSEHYVDGSIDTAHIADSQITTAKIADSNVTTAKIAADAIDGTKIADDSINSEHYVDGSIDTAHIADSQITTAKIADSAITSAKINDGAIVNADINASAAIDATKIHDGTISNTEFGHLNGVTSNIQTQLDAREASNASLTAIGALATTDGNFIVGSGSTWVAETGSTARASLGLGTISTQAANSVAISGGTITGLGAPSASSDAATKNYVDNLVAGLKTRIITRVATTANITLSSDLQNGDTLDGITLATGNKILVKNQTDATENGIYNVVASGTATRDTDYDTVAELAGQLVIVQEGSTNADKIFLCTTDNSGSIGSVNIVFTIVQPSNVGDVTLNGVQTLTNKTLTSPVISEIVSVSDGNISVLPNGSGKVLLDGNGSSGGVTVSDGLIDIRTGTGNVSKVKFYCESSNAHAQTLQAQPHSAGSSSVSTLPAATGTLIGTGDTGTLPLAAIDIDGGTDIGADLTTSDLIIVDDGAGGTNRKAALSRIVTLVNANTTAATPGFAVAMAIAL
jgi:hypothetical protein|tara:strand:- start:417 stop:2492 length:2076 start_codon:yes stop_codon:yes gene_type:complete